MSQLDNLTPGFLANEKGLHWCDNRESIDCFAHSYEAPTEALREVLCTQLVPLGAQGLGVPGPLWLSMKSSLCLFLGRTPIAPTRLLIFLNMKCFL